MLAKIEEKPVIIDYCRVGIIKPDRNRPIQFTLRSSDMVKQVLSKATASMHHEEQR